MSFFLIYYIINKSRYWRSIYDFYKDRGKDTKQQTRLRNESEKVRSIG